MPSDADGFAKGIGLVEGDEMQWVPTPVVAEVYYGVSTTRSDTDEREVRYRLRGVPPRRHRRGGRPDGW